MEAQRGFSARQVGHFEILPRDTAPPARADGLHSRFLGGEPPRITLELIALPLNIRDLRRGVTTTDKFLSVPLDRGFDPRDFRQVHARTADHFTPRPGEVNF